MVSDISCLLHSPLLPSDFWIWWFYQMEEVEWNNTKPIIIGVTGPAHSSGPVMGYPVELPGCLGLGWPRQTSALGSGIGAQHMRRGAGRCPVRSAGEMETSSVTKNDFVNFKSCIWDSDMGTWSWLYPFRESSCSSNRCNKASNQITWGWWFKFFQ